jgi:hypothetical protein
MQNVAIHLFDYKRINKKTKNSLIRLKIFSDAYQNDRFSDIDFLLHKLISNFSSEHNLLQLSLEKITASLATHPIEIEELERIDHQFKSIDLTSLQFRLQNEGEKMLKKTHDNYQQDCLVCEEFLMRIEATLQEEEREKSLALEVQRAAQIANAEKKAAHLEQQRIEAERRRFEAEEKKRAEQAIEQQVLAKPEMIKLNHLYTPVYSDFQKIIQFKADHQGISGETVIELEIHYLALSIKVITLLEYLHTLNCQKGAQNLAARLAHLFPILFTETDYRLHFDYFMTKELPLFIEQFTKQLCDTSKSSGGKLHFNDCQFACNTPETRRKQGTAPLVTPMIDLTIFLDLLMSHISKLAALQQKLLQAPPEFQASIIVAQHCLLRAVIEHYHQINPAHKKEADKILNYTFLTRKKLGLLIVFRNTYRHTKPIEFKMEDKVSDEFIFNTEQFAMLLIHSMPCIRAAAIQCSSPIHRSPILFSSPTLFSTPLNPDSDYGYHSATQAPTPRTQSAPASGHTPSMFFLQVQNGRSLAGSTPLLPTPAAAALYPRISTS